MGWVIDRNKVILGVNYSFKVPLYRNAGHLPSSRAWIDSCPIVLTGIQFIETFTFGVQPGPRRWKAPLTASFWRENPSKVANLQAHKACVVTVSL